MTYREFKIKFGLYSAPQPEKPKAPVPPAPQPEKPKAAPAKRSHHKKVS